jgi:hypothetical protein
MTSGNRMPGDLCLWALADAEHETRHVPTRMSALPGHAASRIIADLGIARVRNVRVGPPTPLRCLGTLCTGVLGHRSRFGLGLVVAAGIEFEVAQEPPLVVAPDASAHTRQSCRRL